MIGLANKKINCFQCKYFYTTWDPKSPRGCRAFQFKTTLMPSIAVLRSSGRECMKFEAKSKG
ncbi:uracil-DNA glycosylase [Bacillus timonensis]|nr:uracil-DNA glycosylase [Bacillus timonensis]